MKKFNGYIVQDVNIKNQDIFCELASSKCKGNCSKCLFFNGLDENIKAFNEWIEKGKGIEQ